MTKAEKLLRRLIAEAVMSSVNEAVGDDDESEGEGESLASKDTDLRRKSAKATERFLSARDAAFKQYMSDNPDAIETASAGSAMPTVVRIARPKREPRQYLTPGSSVSSRKSRAEGLLPGNAPYIGTSHDHLEGMRGDVEYIAGSAAVNAYRDLMTHHNDPSTVLKSYLYKDVSLISQVPETVSYRVIHEMVLTPAVLESLLKSSNKTATQSAASPPAPTPAVPSDAAEDFASKLTAAYSKLSRSDAEELDEDDFIEAADKIIAAAHPTVVSALMSAGTAVMKAGVERPDRAILVERIRTQANSIRPYMQQASDAVRKIRRVAGGSIKELQTSVQKTRDPRTGFEKETTFVTGMRDRDTTGALIIPRTYTGFEANANEDKLSDLEEQIFDHSALTKFKHTQARGYYNVARASYLLSLRERVEAYYKNTGREDILEGITPVFDHLTEAFEAHPYSRLGIKDVASAKRALARAMAGEEIGDGSAVATITLGDVHIKQAQTLADFISKSSITQDGKEAILNPLNALINAAASGEPVSSEIVDEISTWIPTSRTMLNNGKVRVAALVDALDTAKAAADEGATAYTIVPEQGSVEVEQSKTPPPKVDGETLIEGNEEDNRRLEESIELMVSNEKAALAALSLAYATEQASTVPAGAAGGKDTRRNFRAALRKNLEKSKKHVSALIEAALKLKKPLAESVDQAVLSLKSQVDAINADRKAALAAVYSIIDRSEASARRSAAIRASLIGAYKSMKLPPTLGEMIEKRIETARSLRCEDSPGKLFLTPRNKLSGAAQIVIERNLNNPEDIVQLDTGSPYAFPAPDAFGETNLTSRTADRNRGEFLKKLIARMKPMYRLQLGSVVTPGQAVVIPSLMRTPPASVTSDMRLTLGVGRVVNTDVTSISITNAMIATLPEDVRPYLRVAQVVNIMTATVSFGPGQWRLGSRDFDTSKIAEMEETLSTAINSFERGSSRMSPAEQVAARKKILELQRNISTSYPGTTAAVRSALTNTDSTLDASFVNTSVSVNEATGVLTMSMIAPAFLDLPTRHTNERTIYKWSDSAQLPVYNTTKGAIQTLLTSASRGVVYMPASSVQIQPEHEADLDSPFNINQPPVDDQGTRNIAYRVGGGGRRRTIGINPASFELEDLDEARSRHIERLRRIITVKGVQVTGSQDVDVTAKGTYPVAIRVPTSADPALESIVQSAVESDVKFMRDYYLVSSRAHVSPAKYERDSVTGRSRKVEQAQETGDLMMVYELRTGRRDVKNRISRLGAGGSTIGVGDMVYISPMYEVLATPGTEDRSADFVAANKSSPPELYGVGKVTRIYFHGTEGGDKTLEEVAKSRGLFKFKPSHSNEFRALLADVEFRGDQVKTHGVRGSLFSPNVSLNGVGVAFLTSLPKSLDADTRKFEAFDPDRGIMRSPDGDLTVNYPNAPLTNNVIYTAGWDMLSPHDRDTHELKKSSTSSGVLEVGNTVQIIQASHPMVGAVGEIVGFVGAAQLTQGQLATIRSGGMSPSPVNAIVAITGADIMGQIHGIVGNLSRQITGKPYSTNAIYQLFKHIDREITKRYIANPKNASGYLAYDSGRWSGDMGTNIPVQDVIGTRSLATSTGDRNIVPEHGSGAWQSFHAAGHAVHPGAAKFGEMTGRKAKLESISRPGSKNTLYGCNAIFKAIIEHGPEKTITAEESYEAERQQLTSAESSNIAGTFDKTARNPYPVGHHTEESVYFLHLKTRWVMAGGGKSGRSTEGAKSGYIGYATTRVGSPVGTSFRFQLTPNSEDVDPDFAGLEYTMLLRQEMRSVAAVVKSAIAEIDRVIAVGSGSSRVDQQIVNEAKSIKDSLTRRVLGAIESSISFITNLGHADDNGRVRNTIEVWKEVNDELERKHANKIRHDFGDDVRAKLSDIMDNVQTIHTLIDSDGERIFGGAPIPTAQETTITPNGEIVITFSRPQPVHSAQARNMWARTQLDAVRAVGQILNNSLVAVYGSMDNPERVDSVGGSHFDGVIRSMESALEERKKAQIDEQYSLHAWESDILESPSLGNVIRQDYIDSVMHRGLAAASAANPMQVDSTSFSVIDLNDAVFSLMTLRQFESSLRAKDARYRKMYEKLDDMVKNKKIAMSLALSMKLVDVDLGAAITMPDVKADSGKEGSVPGYLGNDPITESFVEVLINDPASKVLFAELRGYVQSKHSAYLAPHREDLLAAYRQILAINVAETLLVKRASREGEDRQTRARSTSEKLSAALASQRKAETLLGRIKPDFKHTDLWREATREAHAASGAAADEQAARVRKGAGEHALRVDDRLIPESTPGFCKVSFKYADDFVAAEEQFFEMLRGFVTGDSGLNGYVDAIISTLKDAAPDSDDNAASDLAAVDKITRQLSRYRGLLEMNTAADWIASNDTSVRGDGMTPDIGARRAAEMAHAAESGFRDIANIIDDGYVLTKGVSGDPRARARVDELHAKLEEARLSNERSALENMRGFPSDRGLQDILEEISLLYQRSMSSRQDQVCVPIRAPSGMDTSPLLRARLGTRISGTALDVVLETVALI